MLPTGGGGCRRTAWRRRRLREIRDPYGQAFPARQRTPSPNPAHARIGDVHIAETKLTPASDRPGEPPTGVSTCGTDIDVDQFSRIKRRAGRRLEAEDDREHARIDLLLPFIG